MKVLKSLFKKSEVKEIARDAGIRLASDIFEALDDKGSAMIQEAIKRAQANGRKTVSAKDV